jgi:hypothetical protein
MRGHGQYCPLARGAEVLGFGVDAVFRSDAETLYRVYLGAEVLGFGVDAVFRSDAETLYRVYLGELAIADAQRSGRLELECMPEVVPQVPAWFAWSSFGASVRAGMAQRARTPAAGRR